MMAGRTVLQKNGMVARGLLEGWIHVMYTGYWKSERRRSEGCVRCKETVMEVFLGGRPAQGHG